MSHSTASIQRRFGKSVRTLCTWLTLKGEIVTGSMDKQWMAVTYLQFWNESAGRLTKPITARDMTDGEKRGYRRLRR